MVRPVCYLDFDGCLYDTEKMYQPILEDLVRLVGDQDAVLAAKRRASTNGYTFERHLALMPIPSAVREAKLEAYRTRLMHGDAYLFPETADALTELTRIADCRLLTYGNPVFQAEKFSQVRALEPILMECHILRGARQKWEVIAQGKSMNDRPTFFLDDQPTHLESAHVTVPWVHLVRMKRSEKSSTHPWDGQRWSVVSSLSEFLEMVERSS